MVAPLGGGRRECGGDGPVVGDRASDGAGGSQDTGPEFGEEQAPLGARGRHRIGRRLPAPQRRAEGVGVRVAQRGDEPIEPRPARASSGAATGPAAGAAAGALIERGCTAVVCASDMMALGAVRAARQAGLQVPRYFSVAGFDDSPLIAFTDPPLTTIRKPVPAMGQAAVRTLLEEVGGTPAPHSEFVFMPELVVRGSTASQPRARHSAA
ncbi:HTH-type transcriptional repressor PurR [Streptomyces canarius]